MQECHRVRKVAGNKCRVVRQGYFQKKIIRLCQYGIKFFHLQSIQVGAPDMHC